MRVMIRILIVSSIFFTELFLQTAYAKTVDTSAHISFCQSRLYDSINIETVGFGTGLVLEK